MAGVAYVAGDTKPTCGPAGGAAGVICGSATPSLPSPGVAADGPAAAGIDGPACASKGMCCECSADDTAQGRTIARMPAVRKATCQAHAWAWSGITSAAGGVGASGGQASSATQPSGDPALCGSQHHVMSGASLAIFC